MKCSSSCLSVSTCGSIATDPSRARLADRHERQHVEAERRLQRRVLEELVEHDLRRRALLQLDDDAHALAVRLVVHARDAGDALLGVRFGDRLDDAALVDLVRDLGDDDLVLAALLDDLGLAANRDRAAAGLVGFANRLVAQDRAAGREIRALDDVAEIVVARRRDRRSARRSHRQISPRLCGGMFVAMPTAMPLEPLTSSCGSRPGSTLGSTP